MTAYIHEQVLRALKICPSRNPYELLDSIGAVVRFSYKCGADGLRGFSVIYNRTMYAVINGNQSEDDQKFAAAHEGAHLILHKNEIKASTVQMMKDFRAFDHSGRYEAEANAFLADYIVSDEDVLYIMEDGDGDFYRTARGLCLPDMVLAYKLSSMRRRGYAVRVPVDLDSRFLGRAADRR